MHLTFRVRFATTPGQSLWLAGADPLPERLPLQFHDQECWQAVFVLPEALAARSLNYSYVLRQPDGSELVDWGRDRALAPADWGEGGLLIVDSWNDPGLVENVFYTEPFKRVFAADHPGIKPAKPAAAWTTHAFQVKAPLLPAGHTPCLLGEGSVLGHWQTHTPILLTRQPGAEAYCARLNFPAHAAPLAYKYGIFDTTRRAFIEFETGGNRVLHRAEGARHTVVNDGFIRRPAPVWRGAGVAVPVFSLRTRSSFGAGEFLDLQPLADWGRQTGLKLIQLLPVNDTSATLTWKDSYPYAAISAFALHPLYLNLAAVATARERPLLAALEPERLRLNALPEVDYEAVMRAKLDWLRRIFPARKKATFRTREYQDFFAANQHWLAPYAAFCHFRDLHGTPDFRQWPGQETCDAGAARQLVEENDGAAFHCFVQFHLHRQLRQATAYARQAGLVVKGDLAIGVYRHSVDVWQDPSLFHTGSQAGAPPDPFATKGQNWGFPTYNWPRMARDGFAWWKQRFAQLSHYFDAFRIDHILGFFRIWTIPDHAVEGILGHFVPALPLEPADFSRRGLPLDLPRLTQPYLTDAVLDHIFGPDAAEVRDTFVQRAEAGPGSYALRPGFATQKQVAQHFATLGPGHPSARLQTGLFDLISNVILLAADDQLHFRFAMADTQSFRHLPAAMQAPLQELYVDYFFRRQDDFWKIEGWQKLPALKRVTNMLICGEDLGLVPACVPQVMRDLGFLSLEIQRMPKQPGRDFSRPAEAPALSVVTPSTHDMSTIRGWWTEDRRLTKLFFNLELGRAGEPPSEATPELVTQVIEQHLASPAMWSIFQLQDLLGMDGQLRRAEAAAERINLPADPNHYWRFRLHVNLEDLCQAEDFNHRIRQLLARHGR